MNPKKPPRSDFIVRLPEELAARLELLLLDPLRGKIRYGAKQTYIESLIRQDLDARMRGVSVRETAGQSSDLEGHVFTKGTPIPGLDVPPSLDNPPDHGNAAGDVQHCAQCGRVLRG
jgi:hypothetical protein